MAAASTEIPENSGVKDLLGAGTHTAYFFENHSEKQQKLFSLCREAVDLKNASLVYIAGKQGVKGIRLSLKDTGFDVSAYEKKQQMRIIDSEEFFLTPGRQQQFRTLLDLEQRIKEFEKEALKLEFSLLVILSETDMLVRKGYLEKYKEFDELMRRVLAGSSIAMICAFDRRELAARGVMNSESEFGPLHSVIV